MTRMPSAFTCYLIMKRVSHIVCELAGQSFDDHAFCQGWYSSGAVGAGKTSSFIRNLLFQVFKNRPNFGAFCVDDKGTLHQVISEMAAHFGRSDDVVLLQTRSNLTPPEWAPTAHYNLIGDPSIPPTTYARCIVETATALAGRREQSFFKNAAQVHISQAIPLLQQLNFEVTLSNVLELLTDTDQLRDVLDELESKDHEPEMLKHFRSFLSLPTEQLAGTTETIKNYLFPLKTEAVMEIFAQDKSTFQLSDVDQGKIILLNIPQELKMERRYVGTFLKQLYFLHALRRFDLNAKERDEKNLLLIVADECQHFLTSSEDGVLSDYNVIDVLREAKVAYIAATQSSTSLIPVLGADKSKVFLLNLRNRAIFRSADEEDARMNAEFIGRKPTRKRSFTRGDGRSSETWHSDDDFLIKPHVLRKLRNHECILAHADGSVRQRFLAPIEPDGFISNWYRPWWKFWV